MEEKISLNQVIKDTYVEKIGRELFKGEMQDTKYKNYFKDSREKLNKICLALNCDLEDFKNDHGTFDLPILVAEIFKVYLLEKSSKGSFISKLRSGKLSDVTFEEKVDFINKVKVNLKEKYNSDEMNKEIDSEVEEIFSVLLDKAKYGEKVEEIIETTQLFTNLLIEASIVKLSGINKLDGFVSVINPKRIDFNNIDMDEEVKKIRDTKLKINQKLTIEDKIELMQYLEVFLKEKIEEWWEIVNIAGEIREADIEDYKFENRNMMKSKEIVNLAISEYKEKLEEERLPELKPPHSPEEMRRIIDEIKNSRKDNK